MPEYFEQESEPGFTQRYLGGWRVVASAWALAVMVVLGFGGVQALASRHETPMQQQLVGAVIPRHDPSCGGPGDLTPAAPASCHVMDDVLDRAEAAAEAGGAYGY
ncbi:MAG TPA: hypothetical protein VL985_04440 [Stellaceae bacterium]|nr:hypothetical protein [Stellaceae bacterium]